MAEVLHYFGVMVLVTLTVTCLGGLYDLRKSGERVTYAGVRKAIAIGVGLPLALLAFGAVSWLISSFYVGGLNVMDNFARLTHIPLLIVLWLPLILLVVVGVARRRKGRPS